MAAAHFLIPIHVVLLRARRNRRFPHAAAWGDHGGRESCRSAAMRGDTPQSISTPKPTAVSRSWTTPRSIAAVRRNRRSDASSLASSSRAVTLRTCWWPGARTGLAKLERHFGESDAHVRSKDKTDKLGRDYARRHRPSAGSRAADVMCPWWSRPPHPGCGNHDVRQAVRP